MADRVVKAICILVVIAVAVALAVGIAIGTFRYFSNFDADINASALRNDFVILKRFTFSPLPNCCYQRKGEFHPMEKSFFAVVCSEGHQAFSDVLQLPDRVFECERQR